MWQRLGNYEFEYNHGGYTGWYRCVGGWMAPTIDWPNGRWPVWKGF